ncbi:RNA 2',3'-cyclic phosphodiesterase [Oleisolibacter albus]|uniref:RNA 2',3'-cyclic phosphodiesterase n=1 Tax=Oleisolibacter albus TaxID=2171757 RepID=UPI000DF13556|nr:RNA 2',3'-cyclic phosphodiesterase [Oleisolibacter albus]
MIRLFVGLALPEEVRLRLARLGGGVPGARWAPAANFHITLRFIGEVDEGLAQDIDMALETVASPPFPLALSGLGSFGKGHRTHTLWAGVERNEALHHLRDRVESALVRAGLPAEERKFSPHVTLARLGDAKADKLARFLEEQGLYHDGPILVDRFVLFESVLGKGGPVYHALRTYLLGARRWADAGDEPDADADQGADGEERGA